METPYPPPQKKGIGALGWIGMGCGGIILLVLIGIVVTTMMYGGKFKKYATEMAANPARGMATTMVNLGVGELVAEDDVNKRYTVRTKKDGQLTTFYWNEKKHAAEAIPGDFSAIPKDSDAPSEPVQPPEQK